MVAKTVSLKRGLFKLGITVSSMAVGALIYGAVTWSMGRDEPRHSLARAIDSSVQVFTERNNGGRRAGSAVIVSEGTADQASLILTTAHTFEPMVKQSVYIVVPPGSERVKAELLALDSDRDLALLAAPLAATTPARLSEGAYLVDPMWVIAFPWGRERTVVNGAVSQIEKRPHDPPHNLFEGPVRLIDASVSYGMSGGGVFHSKTGDLVGLVQGYRTAHLSLPSSSEPLKLPVAGETTVISTPKIACFLASLEHPGATLAGADLSGILGHSLCPEQQAGVAAR